MTGSDATPSFRLAYVPGVMPDKWVRIWNERQPDVPLTLTQVPAGAAAERLLGGEADAGEVAGADPRLDGRGGALEDLGALL